MAGQIKQQPAWVDREKGRYGPHEEIFPKKVELFGNPVQWCYEGYEQTLEKVV